MKENALATRWMWSLLVFVMVMRPAEGVVQTVASTASLMQQNTRIVGNPFVTFKPKGLRWCAEECKRRNRCQSFNFEMSTLQCQLYDIRSNTPGAEVVNQTGYIFSDVSQWPNNLIGVCNSHVCPTNDRCRIDVNGAAECSVTECAADPPVIQNGNITTVNRTREIGDSLEYGCDEGFIKEGTETATYCMSNTQWSIPKMICRDCGEPPAVNNATATGTSHAIGTTMNYTCDSGFSLQDPPASVDCSLAGYWAMPAFWCAPDCPTPPTVDNGTPTGTDYRVGATMNYTCDPGHSVVYGPTQIRCESNSRNNSTWTTPTFLCLPDCPTTVPTVPQATPNGTAYNVLGHMTYVCDVGYDSRPGRPEILCQLDSTWATPNFTCERMCTATPPSVRRAYTVGTAPTYVNGENMPYKCNAGTEASGATQVLCLPSDNWDTPAFTCNPVFKQTVNGDRGTFISHQNWPSEYPNAIYNTYTANLDSSGTQNVHITITVDTAGCSFDFVQINGEKFCGQPKHTEERNITAYFGTFGFSFNTDFSNSGASTPPSGFDLDYYVMTP